MSSSAKNLPQKVTASALSLANRIVSCPNTLNQKAQWPDHTLWQKFWVNSRCLARYISNRFDILLCFEVCWINLCYLYGDVYVYVCVRVCEWTRLRLNGAFDWTQIWYVYYRHRRTNPIEFGECQVNNFFTGIRKRILIQYGQWSQIL